jgi:hypothetical protein
VIPAGAADLQLAAAAGISGPPLEGLVDAVRDPRHPIARTVTEAKSSFDVRPIAPGGPALRSHLPLLALRGSERAVVGVLAVAHDQSLDSAARADLTELAGEAAALASGGD